jgi:pantetheine-phosphate adenylyltransferase
LLEKAFSTSEHVSVGLTSDRMARSGRTRKVSSFDERLTALEPLLRDIGSVHGSTFDVREIDDLIGFALEEGIEAITVSEETVPGARTINERRVEEGRRPLAVIVVDIVRDEHGKKVSSTSITKKEYNQRREEE